jgi:hypothetical protein
LNTEVRVWLESGCYDEVHGGTHDINLDCGGKSFEEAIIKMANLLKKRTWKRRKTNKNNILGRFSSQPHCFYALTKKKQEVIGKRYLHGSFIIFLKNCAKKEVMKNEFNTYNSIVCVFISVETLLNV